MTTARTAVRNLAADTGKDSFVHARLFDAARRACRVAGATEAQVRRWLTTADGRFPAAQAWMLVVD